MNRNKKAKATLNLQELYAIIGTRMRKVREGKHLSQEEMGKLLGMSRVTITNMENGRQGITLENIYLFCYLMETSILRIIPRIGAIVSGPVPGEKTTITIGKNKKRVSLSTAKKIERLVERDLDDQ